MQQQARTKSTVVAAWHGSAISTKLQEIFFGCFFSLRFVKEEKPFLCNRNQFSSIPNSKTRKLS
jgi:hypothetical protein